MWDQRVRVGGFVPVLGMDAEAAIAINVVQHLLTPGRAESLAHYQTLMETLLAEPADRQSHAGARGRWAQWKQVATNFLRVRT
ncbi:hypothetical protein OHT57_01465 [Streptomyces sp. NBC_00285]|uniref:hypothetical protein n=1 Tax=Streptomyces sp. NBC_00285 TaxID=2975700 RepID=UPI002E2D8B04|nr:hypothetical protein [Streptomyces sp. NBC_00285]